MAKRKEEDNDWQRWEQLCDDEQRASTPRVPSLTGSSVVVPPGVCSSALPARSTFHVDSSAARRAQRENRWTFEPRTRRHEHVRSTSIVGVIALLLTSFDASH
jgi:hypothetical protein